MDLDQLVDGADEEARDNGVRGLAAGRERVADEDNIGAGLVGNEVARRVEATRGVIVPVVVLVVGVFLLRGELGDAGDEPVRGFADNGERELPDLRLPDQRRGTERGVGDDLHEGSKPYTRARLRRKSWSVPRTCWIFPAPLGAALARALGQDHAFFCAGAG